MMVDESLAVVNSVHVDVLVLHRVELQQKQSRWLSVSLIKPWLHGNKPRPRTRILKRPVLASSSCCCRTCPGSGGEPSGVSAFLFSPWGG